MKLSRAQAVATTLTILPEVASTNDALRTHAAELALAGKPTHFTVVVSPHQTAGRGRLGRVWVSPPGATLAISVLVAPGESGATLGVEQFGWFPLIAGVAMARAVEAALTVSHKSASPAAPTPTVGIKWPNDVQISGAKVSGILTELTTDGAQLIVGVGVNLDMRADQLPVPTATSLAIAGATLAGDDLADVVVTEFLTHLRALTSEFIAHAGDAAASGVAAAVVARCTTIGAPVRVEFPDGRVMLGTATGIDSTGRLLVQQPNYGPIVAVAAGDVTHLRYE
jgi:BirA family biotin operon repressor/biotin-[acetyl-CoA-carboxylase] ligase